MTAECHTNTVKTLLEMSLLTTGSSLVEMVVECLDAHSVHLPVEALTKNVPRKVG